MMNSGLTKLALNDKVNTANMYAQLEEKDISVEPKQKLAALHKNTQDNKVWDIQVGAFSNYTKARNYALEIKKRASRNLADKPIDIEPVSTGSAIIYRSKITGFAKNEADKACNNLKKSNKSCIVVAQKENKQLILAHNRYQ